MIIKEEISLTLCAEQIYVHEVPRLDTDILLPIMKETFYKIKKTIKLLCKK